MTTRISFRWSQTNNTETARLGVVVVSVVAYGTRCREFDARGLLRFQLPGEA